MSTKTLSEQSLSILHKRGYDVPLQNGMRYLNNASYLTDDTNDAIIAIPDELESFATLQFLELRPETAKIVWADYARLKSTYPGRNMIFWAVRTYVMGVEGDAWEEGDDWYDAMNRIGMGDSYQARVMHDGFKRLRLTGSAKYWALESIAMRMEFLTVLDGIIKGTAHKLGQHVSYLDANGHIRSHTPVRVLERRGSAIPEILEGCGIFYIAGNISRLVMIEGDGNRLDLLPIRQFPPSDFAEHDSSINLTKQLKFAWEEAMWRKILADGKVVPIGILVIAVPERLLTSMADVTGEQWRDLVWTARKTEPADLAVEYLKEYQWLKGPICRQVNEKVLRMTDPSELQEWRLQDGEKAMQYATTSSEMISLLETACVGKVWVTEICNTRY
jgi:hypothetical protein